MKAKYFRNTGGHAFIELYIILALVLVSLAIGFGQYPKHGLKGATIATLLTMAGIILAFMIIIWLLNAFDALHRHLQDRKGYRIARKSLYILLQFCFFSFVGVILCALFILRFDLSEPTRVWALNITVLLAGTLGTFARLRLKERFWPEFGRLCIFLMFSFFGAVLGMAIGAFLQWPLSAYLHAVDLGALIPLGIYFLVLFRRWNKKKTP
jgi:hypothetical protein